MKKIIGIILAIATVISCLALTGCGAQKNLKFGLGITAAYGETKDAEGETKGSASVAATAAAVLLNEKGAIVKCVIDTVEGKIQYTATGEVIAATEYKTKGELGKDYNMAAYAKDDINKDGVIKEWYEQAAAFAKVTEGKTLDEVKKLVAETGRGNDEVMAAGCTIYVSDFVKAVEKAITNAVDSKATADDNLSIGFVTKQEKAKNATADKDGSVEVVANISAVVTGTDKKVVAIKTDVLQTPFAFSIAGASKTDTTKALATKAELGDSYNMATYGKSQDKNGDGIVKEWDEQAIAYDNACIGKTAAEISALVAEDGYGVESLQTACCTIGIADMVAATVKAAK